MTSKHVLALLLSVGLTACGGGGGGTDTRQGSSGSSGGGTTGQPQPDTGGGTTEQPPPDYSGHYRSIGVEPKDLPRGLQADEAVAPAVVPGYVAIGTLMASLDVRMALQAYEWFVHDHFDEAVTQPGDLHPSVACTQEGRLAVFGRDNPEPSAPYASGEVVRFGFSDCVPTYGSLRFTSDGPSVAQPSEQRYMRSGSEPRHYFTFEQVTASYYPGFTLSGGPLVRYTLDDTTKEMIFSNATEAGAATTVAMTGAADGTPVKLFIQGADRGVSEVSAVRTTKSTNGLIFEIPHLNVGLELDGSRDDVEGSYVLSTVTPMEISYGTPPQLFSGSFKVQRVGGASYTYSLDADPAYLLVEIDEDGDGTIDAQGRVSQALVINRLNLTE